VLALPELEHQEAPESVRVVPPPGNVLVQEPGDGSRPEQPAGPGEFVGVEISAAHPRHPGWARPATFYFRRAAGAWTLVGCIVSPAFEFDGFELAPADWEPPVADA